MYIVSVPELILYIVLLLLPFQTHQFSVGSDIATLLTIVSLFFAILVGFFIATATSNYLRLQTLISDENANLISIFQYVTLIDPTKAPTLADAIDRYMIAALDYDLLEFAVDTRKQLHDVIEVVNEVKPHDDDGRALYQNLHSEKSDLFTSNEEISLTAKKIVSKQHWLVLVILAVLVALLMLALNSGFWFSSLMIGILLICLYQILKLMHAIDSNLFLAKQLAYENPQHVFKGIGKLPYYPETAFERCSLKTEPTRPYRKGVYRDIHRSFDKTITVVE